MKEEYIRQVGRRLALPAKRKREVLRDLEEIFASAAEHGEPEAQVAARLGPPEEYAALVRGQLPPRRAWPLWAGLGACLAVCLAGGALFFGSRQLWLPGDAIGYAQGSTGIQVAGAFDLSPLLLVLAAAGLAGAAFFAWRLAQRRGR